MRGIDSAAAFHFHTKGLNTEAVAAKGSSKMPNTSRARLPPSAVRCGQSQCNAGDEGAGLGSISTTIATQVDTINEHEMNMMILEVK